jgi:tetratricopeptide (TPR) repeat protein
VAHAVRANAARVNGLARARIGDGVRRELLLAMAELHRLAGSVTYDAGGTDHRRYFATALELAREAGHRAHVARVIDTVGQIEVMNGRPDDALKLYQLAALHHGRQPVPALLSGRTGKAYAKLGHREQAYRELDRARSDATDESTAVGVDGLIGASLRNLGEWEGALAAEQRSLTVREQDPADLRATCQATTSLASLYFASGDRTEGINAAQRALQLAGQVNSRAVRGGLRGLARAAGRHSDSTCRDLARTATTMATHSRLG